MCLLPSGRRLPRQSRPLRSRLIRASRTVGTSLKIPPPQTVCRRRETAPPQRACLPSRARSCCSRPGCCAEPAGRVPLVKAESVGRGPRAQVGAFAAAAVRAGSCRTPRMRQQPGSLKRMAGTARAPAQGASPHRATATGSACPRARTGGAHRSRDCARPAPPTLLHSVPTRCRRGTSRERDARMMASSDMLARTASAAAIVLLTLDELLRGAATR